MELKPAQAGMMRQLKREVVRGLASALARQRNDRIVHAPEASPTRWVFPSAVVEFACGRGGDDLEVADQQQIFMMAVDPPYNHLAPRAYGAVPWGISAAFDQMKLPKPSLPPAAEKLFRLYMVMDRSAEILGSYVAKAAARVGGQRAVQMPRRIPRMAGLSDGGFDDVFLTPFVLAQQSFGGPKPGVAVYKKQPKYLATNLFASDGGQLRMGAFRRRFEIWPDLMDRRVDYLLLGFHKSSPGGPPFMCEANPPLGRASHRLLSCVVIALGLARMDTDEFLCLYDELVAEGLVRLQDEVIGSC